MVASSSLMLLLQVFNRWRKLSGGVAGIVSHNKNKSIKDEEVLVNSIYTYSDKEED
jgi:hypothetical protein